MEDVAEHGTSHHSKVVIRMNDNLQHPSGTRRIAWVDYGKGLAILLVFWGHTICPEPIRIFFYAFRIPLFYALSGFVFSIRRYQSFSAFIWRKFRTLIVPGIFFGCIIKICQYVRAIIRGEKPVSPVQTLVGVFTELRGGPYEFLPWFFLSLFVIEIVAYWFVRKSLSQGATVILAVIAAITGYCYGTYVGRTVPWCLDTALTGFFFFVIGFIAKSNWEKIERFFTSRKINPALAYILLYGCSGMMSFCNIYFSKTYLDVYSNTFGWFIFYLPAALFGIAAVVTSLIQLSRMSGLKYLKTALNYAGKNSLIFYAMNHVLIYAWTDLFEQGVSSFGQTTIGYTELWQGLLIVFVSVLCCWPISAMMNRFFPVVLGK